MGSSYHTERGSGWSPAFTVRSILCQLQSFLFAEEIEQFQLATILEQATRLARPMEIYPMFTQALQHGQSREATVDGDLRRFFARDAALQN